MVELNPRVKNLPKNHNSIVVGKNETSHKCTAIASQDLPQNISQNSNLIKSSNVPIKSTIAKHSSPTSSLRKSESDSISDKESLDSVSKSIDSDSSEWRINKYIPKSFRRKTPIERKNPSILKLIHFDINVLNSCTAYSQILILVTSLVIVFIILFNGCFESQDKNNEVEIKFDPNNTTKTKTEKSISKVIKCSAQYYFLSICTMAANFEILTLLCYIFHVVEALPNFPWLLIETIFYSFLTIQYFIISIWISFYLGWLLMAAVLGIIDSLLLMILALIKYSKYKYGKPAQERSDDPDGDSFRRISPNLKFKKTDQQNDVKRDILVERTESLDSLL